MNVCAGPLIHRGACVLQTKKLRSHCVCVDPCIGYIIHEPATLAAPRKLAILGDTSDASQLTQLVRSTPGRLSLLVHEATDAHMPPTIDARLAARRPPALVASKARERGHSTPSQAGACAGQWGAEQLILNHIGTRYVYHHSRAVSLTKNHAGTFTDSPHRLLARARVVESRLCVR